MIRRRFPIALLAVTLAAAPVAAAAATPAAASHAPAPARRAATAHAPAAKRATTPHAPQPAAGPRRLTDVHIEGEMPVPQVLFITARDQRRYVDFQHQRYLRDSRALGAATATPTRVSAAGDDAHH